MSSDADADANTNTSDSERQSVRRQHHSQSATAMPPMWTMWTAIWQQSDETASKWLLALKGGWVRVDAVQRLAQLQM